VQWFPKYSAETPGEDDPPPIPAFHAGLPTNFEQWPQALVDQGKPTLQWAGLELFDEVFGFMPHQPSDPGYPDQWFKLLDLYYQVTQYVDKQVGAVLDALNSLDNGAVAANTIVLFVSDHGEYGGAHGLHGKGFGLYEESIRVPLYVKDPTNTFIPPNQVGTQRNGLTSHVDLVPLLMTLAGGGNAWRNKPKFSYLAGRADLAAMLSNPAAPGRPYILHSTDEDIPEEGPRIGIPYTDILARDILPPPPLAQQPPPTHAIGYRTAQAKLGTYSYWKTGTLQILAAGQQTEMYDYNNFGIGEVVNNAPGGSTPEPALFAQLYDALFNPRTGAVANELRQPLPANLKPVQQKAFNDYLKYEASLGT